MNPFDALRSCASLSLVQLHEGDDGALEVVAKEAGFGAVPTEHELAGEPDERLRNLLRAARVVEHLPGCATFRIRWPRYISYAMLNESFALPEPAMSLSSGRLLAEYSTSRFLDDLKGALWGYNEYPGQWKHWELHCSDHVLQVVSTEDPHIELAGRHNRPVDSDTLR